MIKRGNSPLGRDVALSGRVRLRSGRGSFSFEVTTVDCRSPDVGALLCELRKCSSR